MKKLYIIGNGFDLYHELPTSYIDYATWLKETDNEILNEIYETFGECDRYWWCHFEDNLASVDAIEYAYNIVEDNMPDYAADDFSDGDWYSAEYAVEENLSEIYSHIQKSFTEWIHQIDLSGCLPRLKMDVDDAIFLTFNYTDTLEKVYKIDDKKINHIHGRSFAPKNFPSSELVLGHGKDEETLEEENPMPQGEDVEYYEIRAYEEALKGVANKKKPTDKIIAKNRTFFEKLSDIEAVIIMGFSFSEIDLPYLEKICQIVDSHSVRWISNDYEGSTRKRQVKFYEEHGIQNYALVEDLSLIENAPVIR